MRAARGGERKGNDVKTREVFRSVRDASAVFARDVGNGLLEVSHNGLALLGLLVLGAVMFVGGQAELRQTVERHALDWLQQRNESRAEQKDDADLLQAVAEPDAVARATAADPRQLNRQQAAVAQWISRRYRVAPEPISRLVQEAWQIGQRARLDPTLILAIMAVESSFNPFAQSTVGAQGLMQVLTRVHDDKYEVFGGNHAAFDPLTNLRVGVQVLKECIARAGSLEGGLRYYVGAANLADDGGYASKVLGEQAYLQQVAAGRRVAPSATPSGARSTPAPAPVAQAAQAAAPAAVPVTSPAAATQAPATAPAADPLPPAAAAEQVAMLR